MSQPLSLYHAKQKLEVAMLMVQTAGFLSTTMAKTPMNASQTIMMVFCGVQLLMTTIQTIFGEIVQV